MEKQTWRIDLQTWGEEGRRREGEMYRRSNMESYITKCKIDSQREFAVCLRKPKSGGLYQPRGVGWGGRWEGASKGRGCMYTSINPCMVDSW